MSDNPFIEPEDNDRTVIRPAPGGRRPTASAVPAATLPPATDVSAGHDHTCAVDTGHNVWCWGNNAFGQLGNGTISVQEEFPQLVLGIQATQVSAGDGATCDAIFADEDCPPEVDDEEALVARLAGR